MNIFFKLESKLGEKLEFIFDTTNEAMWFLALAFIGLASFKIAILAIVAVVLSRVFRRQTKFDPGFKRTILLVGYFLNNFELALQIIFLVNLIAFVANLLILDHRHQKEINLRGLRI